MEYSVDDDRTPHEQAEDLGIIPKKASIVGVKWFPRIEPPKKPDVIVAKTSITFSERAVKSFGSDHIVPAVGRDEESNVWVLIICPTSPKDQRGYKLRVTNKGPKLSNAHLVKKLLDAGLKPGKYELRKNAGGNFIARPK